MTSPVDHSETTTPRRSALARVGLALLVGCCLCASLVASLL